MMQSHHRRHFLRQAGASAIAGLPLFGHAQASAWPSRPILLINGYTAGGNTDVFLRETANLAGRYLPGAQLVVENRPGANSAIAVQSLKRAKPDGYTVMQFTTALVRAPFIQETPYHPLKDFTYIIAMADIMLGIAVRADAPWRNLNELMAAARAQPGKISYATPGLGTAGHIVAEELSSRFGVKLNHILYKGAEYVSALGGGHVDVVIDTPTWAPLVESGRARLIGVVGSERMKRWPTVPTLSEQGVAFGMNAPFGLVGPKDMDPVAVRTLHDAFRKSMDDPDYEKLLDRMQFKRFYRGMGDFEKWATESFAFHGQLLTKMGLSTRTP